MNILKYKLLISVFLLFVSSTLFGQNYGVKAGMNLSTLNGYGAFSLKPGAQIGAFTELARSDKLYFKGEVLFSQKGSWNWNFGNLNNVSLYYMDIAVMYGISVFKGISINLGFQPSLRLGGTHRFHGEDGLDFNNVSSDLALMDYSTLFGIEYEYKEGAIIGTRFTYGFIPIQKYGAPLQLNNDLPFNLVFQVYYGVKIGRINYLKEQIKDKMGKKQED